MSTGTNPVHDLTGMDNLDGGLGMFSDDGFDQLDDSAMEDLQDFYDVTQFNEIRDSDLTGITPIPAFDDHGLIPVTNVMSKVRIDPNVTYIDSTPFPGELSFGEDYYDRYVETKSNFGRSQTDSLILSCDTLFSMESPDEFDSSLTDLNDLSPDQTGLVESDGSFGIDELPSQSLLGSFMPRLGKFMSDTFGNDDDDDTNLVQNMNQFGPNQAIQNTAAVQAGGQSSTNALAGFYLTK